MGVTVIESYQHILVQSGSTIRPQASDQEDNETEQSNQIHQFRAHWKFEEEATGDPQAIVSALGDGTAKDWNQMQRISKFLKRLYTCIMLL